MPEHEGHIRPVVARTFTTCMEQLQEAVVGAVAATAGCTMDPVGRDVYGIDTLLTRLGRTPHDEEISVKVALKASTRLRIDRNRDTFSYQFRERSHFDRLAMRRTTGPKAILVVMSVPPDQSAWTKSTHDETRVQHCCYWVCLEGKHVSPDVKQPTVRIPTANIFDADALTSILDRLEREEDLT